MPLPVLSRPPAPLMAPFRAKREPLSVTMLDTPATATILLNCTSLLSVRRLVPVVRLSALLPKAELWRTVRVPAFKAVPPL